MSLTTIEIVTAICPDLASSPAYDVFTKIAEQRTDRGFFGDNYTLAVALRASHMFVLSQRPNGESGMISSKSEGKLSLSFAASNSAKSGVDLTQTSFGVQLLELIENQGPGVSIALTGVLGGLS